MEIFYSEEDKQFYTIPDGDIAKPEQIKQYYDNKIKIPIPIKFKCNNTKNNIDEILEEKKYGRTSL